jgi:phage terminase large subunit-like protein
MAASRVQGVWFAGQPPLLIDALFEGLAHLRAGAKEHEVAV